MLLAAVFAWASFVCPALAASFVNPIVAAAARTGSADPSVVFHRGYYFYCRVIGNGEIGVARARRLQDIGAAPLVSVFRPPAGTPYSRQVWAPELQRVRGRWYIYFSASDGVNANHRMVVLQAETDDPQGAYTFKGRVADPADGWAIDGVALELRGRLYFVWSGWPDARGPFPQVLYIAPMSDAWTISGDRHLIAAPEFDWERAGAPLLEAPQPLHRGGATHIVYSAGASWGDDYALGLLRYLGGDPLDARSWIKHDRPVLTKNPAAGVFGLGHPSFVRSPDGREDWIVYHATTRPGAGWAGRAVWAQRFEWGGDGRPVFGEVLPAGVEIEEPAGTPSVARQPGERKPAR